MRLALMEQRHVAAARLIGFADRAWRSLGRLTPFSRETRATAVAELEAQMNARLLDTLVAEGELLDEEAVVVLTMATHDKTRRV